MTLAPEITSMLTRVSELQPVITFLERLGRNDARIFLRLLAQPSTPSTPFSEVDLSDEPSAPILRLIKRGLIAPTTNTSTKTHYTLTHEGFSLWNNLFKSQPPHQHQHQLSDSSSPQPLSTSS